MSAWPKRLQLLGVLSWFNLDPQASASIWFAGDDFLAQLIENGRTIDAFLEDRILGRERVSLDRCIHMQISDVSHRGELLPIALLASSPALRVLEREIIFNLTQHGYSLNAVVGRLFKLIEAQLRKAAEDYDYIIMDCAPGISALTEVGIRTADMVIVPTIPDSLSTYGLQAFCNSIWTGENSQRTVLRKPPKPRVLITRRKATKEQNKTVSKMRNEMLSERPSFDLFETEIPESTKIAEAFSKRLSTFNTKWSAEIVPVLDKLSAERGGLSMALDLDGFAVFRAIASTPEVFKSVSSEINKTARSLALKQLKAKTADIQNLRDIRQALHTEFDFVLDGMKATELKTLVRKYDKYRPELKSADARWCLRHLSALANGSENPLEKPRSATKEKVGTKRRAPKAEPERLSSRAMAAVRKRVT